MKAEGTQASRAYSPVKGVSKIPGIIKEDPISRQGILARFEFYENFLDRGVHRNPPRLSAFGLSDINHTASPIQVRPDQP